MYQEKIPARHVSQGLSLLPDPSCCYLLQDCNRAKTYIGKSNDPHRRLRQHNGEIVGGACSTLRGRPWTHVCIVSGFPTSHDALGFEWHWKHPRKSSLLKSISIENQWVYGKTARKHLALALMKQGKFADMPLVFCDCEQN